MTERVRRLKTDTMQHDFYQIRNRGDRRLPPVSRALTHTGKSLPISALHDMVAKSTAAAQLSISSDTSDSPSGDKSMQNPVGNKEALYSHLVQLNTNTLSHC